MSKIPVLIAARNEARSIGRTLESLSPQTEPIVIPNGCVDQTAEIARSYGATVIETDIEGKMTALQTGLRYLGKRALEPFITMDADSRPVFPSRWMNSLLAARCSFPEREPSVTVGTLIYTGGTSVISSLYRTVRNFEYALYKDSVKRSASGANMLVHPVTSQALEQILEIPLLWPGEDTAIKNVIAENGGNVKRTLDHRAMVFTDSDRYAGLMHRIIHGREASRQAIRKSYLNDAPPGSITRTGFVNTKPVSPLAA